MNAVTMNQAVCARERSVGWLHFPVMGTTEAEPRRRCVLRRGAWERGVLLSRWQRSCFAAWRAACRQCGQLRSFQVGRRRRRWHAWPGQRGHSQSRSGFDGQGHSASQDRLCVLGRSLTAGQFDSQRLRRWPPDAEHT
jgi:hypothetical protein